MARQPHSRLHSSGTCPQCKDKKTSEALSGLVQGVLNKNLFHCHRCQITWERVYSTPFNRNLQQILRRT